MILFQNSDDYVLMLTNPQQLATEIKHKNVENIA